MPNWIKAVDSSFDELTYEEAQRLKDSGVELYIQSLTAYPATGLMQPESRVISLRNAYQAGLRIAGYAILTGQDLPGYEMQVARSGVPDDLWNALEFCAVDVELAGITYPQVNAAVNYMRDLLPRKPAVIYTNYHIWHDLMGNQPVLFNAYLWNAYWDGDPDADFTKLPFGTWALDAVIGEQWSGGSYVEGQFVDRNMFDSDKISHAVETPPTDTLSQLDRIESKLDRVLKLMGE